MKLTLKIQMMNIALLISSAAFVVTFSHAAKKGHRSSHGQICETHDYVIVGGGTSGLTLGYLLNKDCEDVAVLEAGDDVDDNPNIVEAKPIGALENNFRNDFFYLEDAKPNPNAPNDEGHYSGGRCLGGTSSVNDQIYWRGMLKTYAQWGGLFADANYVINVFKSAESYSGTTQNPAQRGKSGPFVLNQSKLVPIGTKMANALHNVLLNDPVEGGSSVNVPVVADWNVVNGPAISPQMQLWINPANGERQSTSIALLKNTGSTLDVRTAATVLKIVFSGKKAVAIQYLHEGKVKYMYARKKIILCAGARSCAVLLKSGVGPKDALEKLSIPVILDNPEVGRNFRNHIFITPVVRCPVADNEGIARPGGTALNKDVAFVAAVPDTTDPDLSQCHLEFATINPAPGISVMPIILNAPSSAGFVSLFSKDPLHALEVVTNYLSEPSDVRRLKVGLEILKKVIKSLPGYEFVSDVSNAESFIRQNATHIHHYTGTCGFGKVVDQNMHVMGLENIMVADVSIEIPTIQGHTYASGVLIGAAAYTTLTGNYDVNFSKESIKKNKHRRKHKNK